MVSSVLGMTSVARSAGTAAATPSPDLRTPASGSVSFSGAALPTGLESWVLVLIVAVAMLIAMASLLIYGWITRSNGRQESNSVVRAWIAVSLVAGVLILTAATLGGTDTGLQNVLIGSMVAASGSAVAFYFATKSAESANAAVLKAAGIAAATEQKSTLLLSKTADPTQISGAADGATITFHFKVTNGGTQPLTGVHVSDSLAPPAAKDYVWPGAPGDLAPGAVATATSQFTVTADAIKDGAVSTSATATGKPPSGPDVNSEREFTTTRVSARPDSPAAGSAAAESAAPADATGTSTQGSAVPGSAAPDPGTA